MTTASATAPVGSPADVLNRAGQVPALAHFPAMDELSRRFADLAALYPDQITVQQIGSSRLGEPIPMYSVGSGSRTHLVVGGVHPNEPVGSWTALHLLEQLASDAALLRALDASWAIVPCIDPDGYRLNEGWFDNAGDRGLYSRRFYRPAPNEQVEWTFPFAYKKASFDGALPETSALMSAIDATRPQLYVALHNAELGGAYYYLNREMPGLYGILTALPASLDVPLDRGEPESPLTRSFAPAIFDWGRLEDVYDWLEELGMDPYPPNSSGDSSSSYTRKYGSLTLIAELPYWKHPDADDEAPCAESYSAVLNRVARQLAADGDTLSAEFERAQDFLRLDTPFLRATRSYLPLFGSTGEAQLSRSAEPANDRPATVAERFGCEDLVQMYRLRYGGMLLRALEAECAAGTATAEVRRAAAAVRAIFNDWQRAAEAEDRTEVIPIASLVGIQYGATIAAAAHLAGIF